MTKIGGEAVLHPKAEIPTSVVEMPCAGGDGVQGVGIVRLRMTSTSWASCFAQDDRAKATFHTGIYEQL